MSVEFYNIRSRLPLVVTAALAGGALACRDCCCRPCLATRSPIPRFLAYPLGQVWVRMRYACVRQLVCHCTWCRRWRICSHAYRRFVGAMVVMALLLVMSNVVKSSTMLLIVGILIGYIASSAISLLNFFATEEGVHSFVIWGLGNFSGVHAPPIAILPLLWLWGLPPRCC